MQQTLIVRHLGLTNFEATCLAMQNFTLERSISTPDELWLTEHEPVYTLGLNRKHVRLPTRHDIPIINTDRGGKITYHGPGQIIIYALLDLTRYRLNIRSLVTLLENTVIELLATEGIIASANIDAPGVYVASKDFPSEKIASLGLRIKNNCCYHGLSLNVDMDLTPFEAIDPCGYTGLKVTQTKNLGIKTSMQSMGELLAQNIAFKLERLHK